MSVWIGFIGLQGGRQCGDMLRGRQCVEICCEGDRVWRYVVRETECGDML